MPATAGVLLFLAPALGPTLGGLLIPVSGWPTIFLVNVPVGLVGFLGMLRVPPQATDRGDPSVRFDPLGLVLLAGGLTLALYGAAEGPLRGWTAPEFWPCWASGAALLALSVPWSLRRPHPAVDLRLLRQPEITVAIGLSSLASVVMFVMLFLIPVFLQTVQGLSPLQTGLVLLPQGLVTGLGTVVGDKLPARYGVRRSVMLGMGILALCTAALLLVEAGSPAWVIAVVLSGRGLALGLTIQPLLQAMLAGLGPAGVADANTLFNVAQRLAGSVGISLLATFFQVREQVQVERVLEGLGLPAGALSVAHGSQLLRDLPTLSASARERLAQAAVAGFHDTIGLLVVLSLLGLGTALLLRAGRQTPQSRPWSASRPGGDR